MTNNKYTRLVKLQKAFFNEHITREIPFRLCALDRLAEALVSREKQLGEALHADLGKSAFESYATEIGFLLHEIRTIKNHLQSWARDRRRPTPLFLFGSKSRIHYEPYGCTLIIAPWNYPLQLALSPLIGAIAAGNCAIVKPSGEAPRTAAALQELIDECFEEEYIAVTDADRETTELLLQERFDYIFYTGGVEYGRHVMQAASRHLTPVTLELGGKSPCIVDDDADLKAAARRTTLAAIRDDEADLIVGTHAILSEGVEFARLGLAVVDEQHRFGVRQRGLLAEKAANPHLLVMSATPIPRTLGLLMYGDLDISILDELPPGRKPVKTRCITGKKRADLYGFLDREIDSGRQAYIVCPAIEDAGGSGLNAVKSYYEDIAKAYLPDRRVGLMHGKLKPKEKAEVMDDFKSGRLDALVSTTVIEVGVDVPNATVMVIENAERYGLSTLHQLRGRVGRGAAESWCFLVSDNASESVQKRLKFLCSTSDGFAVAQYDLETRGPGDFFGSRQHGLPTLQIADLMNDTRTLHAAQSEAVALLAEDPLLERPEHALLARQVEQMFDKAGAMN